MKTSASKESEVIVTSAQNMADEMEVNAENARTSINNGCRRKKARRILTDATEKARQLATETEDLKKKTRVFHQRISLMLESQLEQVKSPEWDEILQPFSSYVTDSHEVIKEVLAKQLDNEIESDVHSETGVYESPVTAFDTQAIDLRSFLENTKKSRTESILTFLKRANDSVRLVRPCKVKDPLLALFLNDSKK